MGNTSRGSRMARARLRSGQVALFICDRNPGEIRDLTEKLDRSVGSFVWSPDSKTIFFTAEDHGESPIYRFASGRGSSRRNWRDCTPTI